MKTKITYIFTGPVTRFGKFIGYETAPIITMAVSINQAKNNIEYRLKQKYGLDCNSNLKIDINDIKSFVEA